MVYFNARRLVVGVCLHKSWSKYCEADFFDDSRRPTTYYPLTFLTFLPTICTTLLDPAKSFLWHSTYSVHNHINTQNYTIVKGKLKKKINSFSIVTIISTNYLPNYMKQLKINNYLFSANSHLQTNSSNV